MARRHDIVEGMTVCSNEGAPLGLIVRCNNENFQIERGLFFPDEYLADYGEVGRVEDRRVFLKKGVRELRPLDPLGPEATGLVASEEAIRVWTLEREFDQDQGNGQGDVKDGRKAG